MQICWIEGGIVIGQKRKGITAGNTTVSWYGRKMQIALPRHDRYPRRRAGRRGSHRHRRRSWVHQFCAVRYARKRRGHILPAHELIVRDRERSALPVAYGRNRHRKSDYGRQIHVSHIDLAELQARQLISNCYRAIRTNRIVQAHQPPFENRAQYISRAAFSCFTTRLTPEPTLEAMFLFCFVSMDGKSLLASLL